MGHLSVRGLRLAYGRRPLLDGIDFDCASGSITAIVGANGAGKSTLLRALSGTFTAAGGSVLVDGRPIAELAPLERARAITTVASDADTPASLTVNAAVLEARYAHRRWWDWGESASDTAAAAGALARVGATSLAERDLTTLSSGERQRVWIALALAQNAGVVLLDEPTSHLDVRYARDTLRLIRTVAAEGRAVAVVLHDLNEAASIADRIAVLGEGTLLAYGVPAVALDPAILERAFGVPFERVEVGGQTRVFARDI